MPWPDLARTLSWSLPLLLLPLLGLAIDAVGGLRASLAGVADDVSTTEDDFQVLVPIYGSITYLENVEYLAQYGEQVLLCTTTHESAEFYSELQALADRHGFGISATPAPSVRTNGRRATSGTIRDRVVRDALARVTARYVVCIDADSTSARPFAELVGAMAARDLDVASVPLVPSNGATNLLTRLQRHEYRMAMRLRRVMPWMVSGACHAARTSAYREVMSRHSLFFQGNDVEVGVIARRLRYRVGHVLFDVDTAVPERLSAWWRQRVAWAGGEVRLFLANPHLVLSHPFLWLYGSVVVLLAWPVRSDSLLHATAPELAVVTAGYVALTLALHRRRPSPSLLLMPLYAAFISLVLAPIGVLAYVQMVLAHRNEGLIRARRRTGTHHRGRARATELAPGGVS